MKTLFSILAVMILFTSCSNNSTARLHFVGNNQPVIIETDWTGYEIGDTVMLKKDLYGYDFYLERNYGGEMKDDFTYGTYLNTDSTRYAYGASYRIAVIEKLID
jgi:hypothetical protein